MAMPIPTRPVIRTGQGTRPTAMVPRTQGARSARHAVRPQGPLATCLGQNQTCSVADPINPCLTWDQFAGYYCSACCLP
jgi:hypothetical protein